MKPYTLNEENIQTKIKWRWMFIIAFCIGYMIGAGVQYSYASSEGGIIIDKFYQPSKTYLIMYHNKEVEISSNPSYDFLVMVNKDECYKINVDKKMYLSYNIGEEYYRYEDEK